MHEELRGSPARVTYDSAWRFRVSSIRFLLAPLPEINQLIDSSFRLSGCGETVPFWFVRLIRFTELGAYRYACVRLIRGLGEYAVFRPIIS